MPGQPGNTNNLKTGTRTNRFGLALGQLGAKYRTIYEHLGAQRRAMEAHVRQAQGLSPQGQLSLPDTYKIDGLILQQLIIRISMKQLQESPSADATVKLLGQISHAWSQRSSLLRQLGLDGRVESGNGEEPPADPLTAMLAAGGPSTQPDDSDVASAADASESRTEDGGGDPE